MKHVLLLSQMCLTHGKEAMDRSPAGAWSRGGVVPRGRGCLHLLSTHYTGLAQAQGPDALLGAAPYGEGP